MRKENLMNKLFRIFMLAVFCPLFSVACGQQELDWSADPYMLEPGDQIDGMVITTGADDAPPLWTFCSPAQHVGNLTTSDCSVPVIPRLAIGHIFTPGDDALTMLDWSEINWELTIDDQPIDLESFGTHEFALPGLSHNPSPMREVFLKFTAWDIVLTNLNPGEHTIHGMAQMGSDSHSWLMYLKIEGNDPGTEARWPRPKFRNILAPDGAD
jgi:hypothetical protein